MQPDARFATQTEIRAAAGAVDAELHQWVALGLMPDPRHRGANRNRWPLWALDRARWIRAQREQGASLPRIVELVRHGFGVPSPPILEGDATAKTAPEPVRIELHSLNLDAAERRLCSEALARAGSIVGAAALLGITRHALTRLIKRLGLEGWRQSTRIEAAA